MQTGGWFYGLDVICSMLCGIRIWIRMGGVAGGLWLVVYIDLVSLSLSLSLCVNEVGGRLCSIR